MTVPQLPASLATPDAVRDHATRARMVREHPALQRQPLTPMDESPAVVTPKGT